MLSHLPQELVEREIGAICKRYRITPEDAHDIFNRYVSHHPDLLKKILTSSSDEDITRLKVYKTLIKEVRKQIYYHLRQYQPEKRGIKHLQAKLAELIRSSGEAQQIEGVIHQLLLAHVSTKERSQQYQMFYQKLFRLISPPQTILDIGCGIHPLTYPFIQPLSCPDIYVALDKQPEVIETLTVFAPYVYPARLIPICCDINDVDWRSLVEMEGKMFDIAFLLKLIPVIARQQRRLLSKLAEIPARQLLITAATEAMTRKESIKRREERVLRDFIGMTGRAIIAEFEVGSELGYLLE